MYANILQSLTEPCESPICPKRLLFSIPPPVYGDTFMGLPIIYSDKLGDGVVFVGKHNEGEADERWEIVMWDATDGRFRIETLRISELEPFFHSGPRY